MTPTPKPAPIPKFGDVHEYRRLEWIGGKPEEQKEAKEK